MATVCVQASRALRAPKGEAMGPMQTTDCGRPGELVGREADGSGIYECKTCGYRYTDGEPVKAEELPLCVQSMRCYCAGHARGNPATEPCDTRETVEE